MALKCFPSDEKMTKESSRFLFLLICLPTSVAFRRKDEVNKFSFFKMCMCGGRLLFSEIL